MALGLPGLGRQLERGQGEGYRDCVLFNLAPPREFYKHSSLPLSLQKKSELRLPPLVEMEGRQGRRKFTKRTSDPVKHSKMDHSPVGVRRVFSDPQKRGSEMDYVGMEERGDKMGGGYSECRGSPHLSHLMDIDHSSSNPLSLLNHSNPNNRDPSSNFISNKMVINRDDQLAQQQQQALFMMRKDYYENPFKSNSLSRKRSSDGQAKRASKSLQPLDISALYISAPSKMSQKGRGEEREERKGEDRKGEGGGTSSFAPFIPLPSSSFVSPPVTPSFSPSSPVNIPFSRPFSDDDPLSDSIPPPDNTQAGQCCHSNNQKTVDNSNHYDDSNPLSPDSLSPLSLPPSLPASPLNNSSNSNSKDSRKEEEERGKRTSREKKGEEEDIPKLPPLNTLLHCLNGPLPPFPYPLFLHDSNHH
eukprot:CAMPEP_0174254996 /NCGR_PEP_ID=MMETSP0439-20130205/4327_1 /TAXON_ID=0 /ORGANISM="Stereomyxa ramosa, Strain Chinc5" /LENGTH=415 /DNA_ID=CAMNT_0015336937 /DNA_START=440 /DNA_END=1687 /DNA_ORIENTATION=+